MVCAACGREASAEARFCAHCGAPLRPAASAEALRKTVSVVFIDIVGSTALGERLDPEALRHLMTRWFDTVRQALERHGATVEKFIGDAVMAVFGVPVVHEDDALRAARAALAVREALAGLNDELQRTHGIRVAARTGVHTGEVVVGGAGSTPNQRLATGDAVNVAARLEQAAAAGEILVGAATHAALRGGADLEALPPLTVAGKREPLQAWRLLAVRPDAEPLRRSAGTPFVGRRAELERLQRALDAARAERSCRALTIVGVPGTGKSRLLREFLSALQGPRVLAGRCVAYGQGSTYRPLAEIVRALAGDAPATRLIERMRGVERGEAIARVVARVVDAAGPGGSPEEGAWAFRRLFEALATERPLVLVFDDIHWAEAALLDLIESIVDHAAGAPMLVVCVARPELLESRPAWSTPRAHRELVALAPLSGADAERLLDGLRPERPLPSKTRRRILDAAEGNPLFVEQMRAMLDEEPSAGDDAVPATLQALLAARIDRLPAAEREVLQCAAVEGRHFHRGAAAELVEPATAAALDGLLRVLERKDLVRPDRSALAGDDGFRFGHVLVRDVAYGSLTKEARAKLHARLADRLERPEVGVEASDDLVGHHLEQAVRYRRELGRALDPDTAALARRGGERLAAAGRRALDRAEPSSASTLIERACALLDGDAAQRLRLLPDLARALREHGRLDAAERTASDAVDAARRAGDELSEQRARVEGAFVAFMRGFPDRAELLAIAQRAIAVFERHAAEADLGQAWHLVGMAELAAGDRGAQLQALLRFRGHAIASGDLRRQIEAWNEVGGAMLFGRTPVPQVLAFLDEELAWSRERGLPAVEADALLGGPYLLSRLGRFDEARAQLERSKAICRELGISYGLCEAHSAGARMEVLAGDAAAAVRELHEAIALAARMGAARYESIYRLQLAQVLLDEQQDDEARAELERTRERAGASGSWKLLHARLLARAGAAAEARALVRDVESAAGADDLTRRAEFRTGIAEVLQACGDPAGARAALADAVRLHEEKGNRLPAQRCRERLAALVE